MALSPQWLDELRARITLSGVIMRTTKLQRAGREWKACCPFHDEKTPSFTVNDDKGFYHCFGCGAHGDVIRWMTDQRGLAFMDAVKELASQANLELPAPDPREARRAEQRANLHDVMAAAQDWYRDSLLTDEASEARAYLASRQFDARTVERFGFGYAPNSRTRVKTALARFEGSMLVEAGMLIEADGRDPYDRFRDRLTIPIHDPRGRVIGFAARILDKDKKDAPKYLNSPDTPLFDKGRTLFNLHRAAPAARKAGRIVVVEGQMDVVALANAGIDEVVAPMGTALTEAQLELLWRQADKPILCFDGDAAGQRAAMRAIGRALPMLQPGRSLQFATLPAGMDPDDLIRQRGRSALEELLATSANMVDTLWERERDAAPLSSPEDKAGLKSRLLAHVDTIADRDIAGLYRRELLERFSAFAYPPRERPAPQAGRRWSANTLPSLSAGSAERLNRAAAGGSREALAQAVLEGLARHPDQIGRHAEALLDLAASERRLSRAIEDLLAGSGLEAGAGVTISPPGPSPSSSDKARYSFLAEGTDPQTAREDLAEAVALLVEWPALDAAIAAATARFASDPEGAFAEQQRLRKQKMEFEGRLGQMARKRATSATLQKERSLGGAPVSHDHETG